jgi:uridine kinase
MLPQPRATVIVGIDGPSGSGKTTLAGRLAAALGGVPVVHLADVYPGWDGLEAGVAVLVDAVLRPLAAGTPATCPTWDWERSAWGAGRTVPPAPVVVVEGVGACAWACAPFLTHQVWLDDDPAVRYARAIGRDGDTYAPHWDRWARQEERHFRAERTSSRADVRAYGGDPPVRGPWSQGADLSWLP